MSHRPSTPAPLLALRSSLLALPLALAPALAAAQGGSPCAPISQGPEMLVNDGGGSPDVAVFADGSGIAVWVDAGDGSRLGIRARRIDAKGMPQGGAFFVNTLTDEDQFQPAVAAAGNGAYVVAWQSDVSPGDPEFGSIRARVYGANGSPRGNDFQVNTSTSGDQVTPDVAIAANGDFVVVWYDDSDRPGTSDPRGRDIRARLFRADGTPRGNDFRVNDFTNGTQSEPAVGMAPDGRFVVLWQSAGSPGTDNSDNSIQARIFDASGNPIASQFQVNTKIEGSQSLPEVAVDPDGSFLVAWQSATSDESDQDNSSIHVRGYLPNGAAVAPQKQVNERTAGAQFRPYVGAVGGREFLVVWGSNENAIDPGTQARAVTLEGQDLGVEFGVARRNLAKGAEYAVGGNGVGGSIVLTFVVNRIFAFPYLHPCATGAGVTDCTENATTLCLTGDRFRVTTVWRNAQGDSGAGRAVELTPDTGYFWFFDFANVETVVKVLDACGFNDRFWVFIGGLTDLGIDFLVEDVEQSVVRRYENPLGAAFLTINDTAAFDTCP
ncbi:MAG TPA: hypothetical protein VMV46_19765 [Thermoanaerobaculia bacterium]|nr:hypothetical protein [Thermoanaerobaculia bacterium]